jgi:hypothetical protein
MRRLLSMIVFLAVPLAAQIDRATLTGVMMDPTRSASRRRVICIPKPPESITHPD